MARDGERTPRNFWRTRRAKLRFALIIEGIGHDKGTFGALRRVGV